MAGQTSQSGRKKTPEELRSHRWYGVDDLRAFGHRSRALQMGYDHQDFMGKPIIGIINTWSDINPCPRPFQGARRGCESAASGRPGASPSSCRRSRSPSPSRNPPPCSTCNLPRHGDGGTSALLSDRRRPVLMGGCDKTTPATVYGRGSSMNLPFVFHAGGPDDAGVIKPAPFSAPAPIPGNTGPMREAGNIDAQELERDRGGHRAARTAPA